MKEKEIERKYFNLKKQLLEIGIPIPGSIHKSYRKCGKKGCRCQQSDQNRHGPYFVWNIIKNNKLNTHTIK